MMNISFKAILFCSGLIAIAPVLADDVKPAKAEKPSKPILLLGYDIENIKSIEVPVKVSDAVDKIYSLHESKFGTPPKVDVKLGDNPVIFYGKRSKSNPTAAVAKNNLPYRGTVGDITRYIDKAFEDKKDSEENKTASPLKSLAEQKFCIDSIKTDTAVVIKKVNWCKSDKYSVLLYADRMSDWNTDLLISHELIHLRQYENIPGTMDKARPYWIADGQANGVGFGLLEEKRGFSRRAIALKTKDLKNSNFSFFLGLRYYDYPLDSDRWKSEYPKNHPEYPESKSIEDPPHMDMAGYMTGSFWRHVIRGRPKGLAAYMQMLNNKGPDNPKDSLAWLKWTDNGLKASLYRNRQIWSGGVRQVYSEMIAELADFPDIVARNRTGKLKAEVYDTYLWSEGCKKIDMMSAAGGTATVWMLPYTAKCFRVKMPTYGPKEINFVEKNAFSLLDSNLPLPFNVTALGEGKCYELKLATRGQLVNNLTLVKQRKDAIKDACSIEWEAGYAPLNANDPNGLQGWQTVVFIYAPHSPPDSKDGELFTLNFVRPTAITQLTGEYTVKQESGKKKKKPFPKSRKKEEPQPSKPKLIEPEENQEDCSAEDRAIFACGDVMGFSIGTGEHANQLSRAEDALAKGIALQYLPGNLTRDGLPSLGEIYQGFDMNVAGAQITANFKSGNSDAAYVGVLMKRLEYGETGTFPATIVISAEGTSATATTSDPALSSLFPKSVRTDRTGCVEVLSYGTTGTVTITANKEGLIIGSLSANLYEDNPDDDAACRIPRVKTGQVTSSFATPGIFFIGKGGKYELDFSLIEEQSLIDQDLLVQAMAPRNERSDIIADDELSPEKRSKNSTNNSSSGGGAGAAGAEKCNGAPIPSSDVQGFIAAVARGGSDNDPATMQQIKTALGSMGSALLSPYICKWIAAGRPTTFEMD